MNALLSSRGLCDRQLRKTLFGGSGPLLAFQGAAVGRHSFLGSKLGRRARWLLGATSYVSVPKIGTDQMPEFLALTYKAVDLIKGRGIHRLTFCSEVERFGWDVEKREQRLAPLFRWAGMPTERRRTIGQGATRVVESSFSVWRWRCRVSWVLSGHDVTIRISTSSAWRLKARLDDFSALFTNSVVPA